MKQHPFYPLIVLLAFVLFTTACAPTFTHINKHTGELQLEIVALSTPLPSLPQPSVTLLGQVGDHHWVVYRDPTYRFGLAVPDGWMISPSPPSEKENSRLVIANFLAPNPAPDCPWPAGLAQLTFTTRPVDPALTTEAWIEATYSQQVQTKSERVLGDVAGLFLGLGDQSVLVLRLEPAAVTAVTLAPESAWQNSDVQNLLASLARPEQNPLMPATDPNPPVVTPQICQPFVNLRTGPGTHFALLGQMKEDTPLAWVGSSFDGQWVQVQYGPELGWAYAPLTIATFGSRATYGNTPATQPNASWGD